MIAIGTSTGDIYLVDKKYESEKVLTLKDNNPILCMSFDPKTGTLACGNSTGYLITFSVDSKLAITALNTTSSE